jgi:hypothetical protein
MVSGLSSAVKNTTNGERSSGVLRHYLKAGSYQKHREAARDPSNERQAPLLIYRSVGPRASRSLSPDAWPSSHLSQLFYDRAGAATDGSIPACPSAMAVSHR